MRLAWRILVPLLLICLLFSCQDPPENPVGPTVTGQQALQVIANFKRGLDRHSAYASNTTYDYNTALEILRDKINEAEGPISLGYLSNQLAIILGQLRDRHAFIEFPGLQGVQHPQINARFPFPITSVNGRIVALEAGANPGRYTPLDDNFRFVVRINGLTTEDFLERYNARHAKAPHDAKITKWLAALDRFGQRLYVTDELDTNELRVELENDQGEIQERVFPLNNQPQNYESLLETQRRQLQNEIEEGNFENIFQNRANGIGYIRLPRMFDYNEVRGLENEILRIFDNELENTRALIIDLRNNTGGSRYFIKLFAQFLVQPEQSPWVANKAHVRINKPGFSGDQNTTYRYLFPRDSNRFSDEDREAIDVADREFGPLQEFDTHKFSRPFYTILRSGQSTYNRPVYILVNENTFSAASVFAKMFKDLPNVRIIGTRTDGSSGLTRGMDLLGDNLRLRISTMFSFFRGGRTLDGNGTRPDIEIEKNWDDVLGVRDSQLERAHEAVVEEIEDE